MMIKGFVYLIGCNQAGLFKVGRTKNDVSKRLKQLQTGCGMELHIIDFFETNYSNYIENMIHKCFKDVNTINEWFELSEEQVRSFKELCDKYQKIAETLENNEFFNKK